MVRPLDQKLLRDLNRLKGQVLTIALVVACGIAAFVSMKGNYVSIIDAQRAYYERTRFADVFVRLERAPESVRTDLEQLAGVSRVDTRVAAIGTVPIATMTKPVRAQLLSLPKDEQRRLNRIQVVAGRSIEPGRHDEVVLLNAFAEAHGLQPGSTLPVVINGTLRRLRVVGLALSPEYIMAISPGSITQDPKSFAVLWMGREPLAAAYRLEGSFNDVSLTLQPGASVRAALAEIDRALEPYGGLGAIARSKQLSNYIIDSETLQLEAMSNVVPLIFLAVAALLLNVVLSRLVHLQRPEIAALKAVGYTNAEVGLHFLKFVLAIGALGALLGVGLGTWLGSAMTTMYAGYFKFPNLSFHLDIGSAAFAVAISFVAAGTGAFFAVRQVVRLPPAEAMRPAPPAQYRRSIIDRLGLTSIAGPALHMIVRELERRPLRTIGSSLAISASVGLLVVAGWYRDGLEALLYTQFHEVMREDVIVTFTDPRPARAIHELEMLPGVLSAEGLRSVPVRFKSGHLHRDGTLLGYQDDGELRTARDKWGRPHPMPASGVVLTETLSQLLRVSPGDSINIEVREGDRRTLSVTISSFVDEGFGLQGHMRSESLHRLLQQQPLVSAGLLRVHPAQHETVDLALKRLPYVAAVNRRSEVLQQFREQSGLMITIMTVIITVFGATITVGVVYNNARIALSVRARDLASLRVLGFRRSEISAILLGEMAVQVVLALPLGLWFGNVLIAGIASTIDPETYRLPIIVTQASYGYAVLVTLVASALSGLLVRRKLDGLDLIGVLKTRE